MCLVKFVILIIVSSGVNIFAQTSTDSINSSKSNNGYWEFYIGAAVGPETGLSGMMPKIGVFRFEKTDYVDFFGGVQVSPWVLFTVMLSTNASVGIKAGPLTLESSIGALWYPEEKGYGPFSQGTFNPKIGFNFGRVWLKFGPSFFLFQNYPEDPPAALDLIDIGGQSINIEIIIRVEE